MADLNGWKIDPPDEMGGWSIEPPDAAPASAPKPVKPGPTAAYVAALQPEPEGPPKPKTYRFGDRPLEGTGQGAIGALPPLTIEERLKGVVIGDVRTGDTAIGRAMGQSVEPTEQVAKTNAPVLRFESARPEPGVLRGAAEFATGLTTPENALLMAGTSGVGALSSQLGKTTVSKLISMGFSADMVNNAAQQAPEFTQALEDGDWSKAAQVLTKIGLTAGMAATGLKHGIAADVKTPAPTERQIRDAQKPYVEPSPAGPPTPTMNREARRATVAPPETGAPENVERTMAAREAIIGKPRERWTNSDIVAADELIAEGYSGAGGAPEVRPQPAPQPARPPARIQPPAPAPEQKAATMSAPEAERPPVQPEAPPAREEVPPAKEAPPAPPETRVDGWKIEEPPAPKVEEQKPEPVPQVAPQEESAPVVEPLAQPEAPKATAAVNPKQPWEMNDQEFRVWSAENGQKPKGGDTVYKTKARALEVASSRPDAKYATAVPFQSQGIRGWVIRPNKEYYQRREQSPVKTPQSYNEYAAMSGEQLERLLEQTKGESAPPAPGEQGGLFGSERGSFSRKPTTKPLTPTEQYAKDMIAARESARKGPVGTFMERLKGAVAKLKAEGLDSTVPILDALKSAEKEHGFEVRPAQNIDYAIDRVYRATSLAEQFIKDKGLDKLIRDVEDIDYLDQYLIAKHALDVSAHGFETGRDTAKDVALINDFKNRKAMPDGRTYDQVAQEVARFSDSILDYSVDSGLISKDLAFKLKTMYKDYVPLTRIFSAIERGEFDGVQGRSVASLSKQTVVQKLQGSEREIENPLYSLLEKARLAFSQGERNKAAAMLAGYRELPGMGQLIREAKPGESIPANRSFSYLDAGKKRTFETTPAMASAAKSLEVHSIGLIGKILGSFGRLMKIGTTGINLPFVASNVTADQLHTLVASRYDRSVANPGVFFKALMAALKHDDLWDEVVRSGAGFTSFDQYRGQPKSTIDAIRAGKNAKSRMDYIASHPVASVTQLFRATEDIVSRSEEFGRARLFAQTKERLLKEGRTVEDARILATIEANNALPNYMRAGNVMRPLNAIVPYLNAGVQGVRSFTRSMEKAPVKTSAAIATTLYFPVAMATLWNLSDPERKKVYSDIEEYEKDNNIIIVPPNATPDKQGRYDVIKVKLPPGLNQLTIPLRRALEAAHGLDPVKFSELASAAIGSVSPVEPNKKSLGSTLIPQAIKPSIQALANYDFFRDRPKVPKRMQDLPTEQQAMPYTSGTAKKIAGVVGASPIKTEEFIKDTLGGIGSQVLNASDRVLNRLGAIPADEIGGTSTAEAIASRFSKARGGNTEHKVYEQRADLEQEMSRMAVKKAKATPFYQRIKGNEELAQQYLNTVATRAKAMVDREFSTRMFKKLEADQKLKKMEQVRTRLMRVGVPASIVRATAAPVVPPSRQDRYAIPTPAEP